MNSSSASIRLGASFSLLVFATLAASCATKTEVATRWISPDYEAGPMHKILVVGVAETDVARRNYEDRFAEALREKGADAASSYEFLPTPDRITEEELVGVVVDNQFDGVIVTRLLEVKEEKEYVPPSTRVVPSMGIGYGGMGGFGYYGYYGSYYDVVHSPGYTRTTEIVRLETKLWNAADAQLVWGVMSETFNPKSTKDGIVSVTRTLANQLSVDGFIAKQ